MTAGPSRSQQRQGFDQAVRVTLLEDDVDHIEASGDKIAASVDAMRKMFVGILVALTTSSLLLAVNVIVLGSR